METARGCIYTHLWFYITDSALQITIARTFDPGGCKETHGQAASWHYGVHAAARLVVADSPNSQPSSGTMGSGWPARSRPEISALVGIMAVGL